jgi:uncharacterized protein with GYD domain
MRDAGRAPAHPRVAASQPDVRSIAACSGPALRRDRGTIRVGETAMATFIVLMNWTEQGVKGVKETTGRYEAFKSASGGLGIDVKGIYWTVGAHDIVLTIEGSDQAVMTALLKLGAQGNVRTQTLRAFTLEEMKGLTAKL